MTLMNNIRDRQLIKKIAQKYSLKLILLFGSRASGKNYKDSDFDVAYLSKKDLNLSNESKLIIELSPIFKNENIDLVNLKYAPPLLLYAITKNCRIVYEENPLIFPTTRAYAFKKYIETKPLYEEKFAKLQKKIESKI